MFWIVAGFTALYAGTMVLSSAVNHGVGFLEITHVARWMKLITLLFASVHILRNANIFFERAVEIAFLLVVLVNAGQLIGIDSLLQLYDTGNSSSESFSQAMLDGRVFGTMKNPNDNALMFALFGAYFLLSKLTWRYLYLGIVFIMVVLTQSRTMFVALSLGLTPWLLFQLYRWNKKAFIAALGIGIAGIILLMNVRFTSLSSLFTGEAFQSNSFTTRLDIMNMVFEMNQSSWLLGKGIIPNMQAFLGAAIDSEFASVYLQYGAIGVALISLMIVALFYWSYKNTNRISISGFFIIMIIAGMTNLSFSNLYVAPMFFILLGGIPSSLGMLSNSNSQDK